MHISIDTVQLYQYHHTHTLVGESSAFCVILNLLIAG